MTQKNAVTFPMLHDAGNEVAAAYGLRFTVPYDLSEVYETFGIDLPTYNADQSQTLPVPARLIIDPGGVVRDVDADLDYTVRPEPGDTLTKLRNLVTS